MSSTTANKQPAVWPKFLLPIVVFLVVLLTWEMLVRWLGIHKVILPPPSDVASEIVRERWTLLRGAWITLQSAAAGLLCSAIIGSLIAMFFSQSSWLRLSFYPYVIFLQTVPIVAIAPLLILWFGNEFRTVVLVSCIISIFPIISNVTSGLLSINENLRDLFRMQSANRWQTLMKLRIPAAIPQLILGLRVSCGLAVIGAIVGEFFVGDRGAYEGLGTIITARQGNLKTASMIGAVIACTLLGLVLLSCVQLLNRWILRRWTQGVGFESDN
ncbi:MAG: ABC transporter permease [Pirellula sp.]|jgi:NitT/TauT family transport system permease protein|nr:ABC transporter permease [Pirellula sp.]